MNDSHESELEKRNSFQFLRRAYDLVEKKLRDRRYRMHKN